MKELLNKLVEPILPLGERINEYLSGFTANTDSYPLYLALFGVLALTVLLIGALIKSKLGKLNRFKRDLQSTNKYIESIGIIDEDEVPELYNRIEKLPNAIQQGWAKFMDQQIGYPSDYIDDTVVFSDKKVENIRNTGRHFFSVLGAIVMLVTLFATALSSLDLINNNTLGDAWSRLTAYILLGITIPFTVYLLFYLFLGIIRSKNVMQTAQYFDDFQDNLDRNVTLIRDEIPEFVSENMEEINQYIDEILKNKLDDKEIIELVTTPVFDYGETIDSAVEEEQEEVASSVEKVEEPSYEKVEEDTNTDESSEKPYRYSDEPMVPLSEVDQRRYLDQLKILVDMAIKDKENTTKEDLEDLAVIIATAKENGYPDNRDQEVLDDCLYMLSDLYYA